MTDQTDRVGHNPLDGERLLPTTPAGRQLAAFLRALGSGDRAALCAFMADRYDAALLAQRPLHIQVADAARVHRITGGLTPQAVERSTDRELVLLARAKRITARYRVTLRVAEDPPHRITGNTIWPALRPAGTLVDVGGRRLALRDAGAGRPAVVLDAGLGWTSDGWGWVQDDIARFTRVVSYDRAGLGASDPAPTPRTSRDIAADLHALLRAAAVPPPYVLVGHSLGGLNARLYAHQHPGDVAGLVLVDAPHPDVWARQEALLPPETPDESRLLAGMRRSLAQHRTDPAGNIEGVDLQASAAQARAAGSLGDRPLVVLSAGRSARSWDPDFPAGLSDRLMRLRRDLQQDLARLSTRGALRIAEESGHLIHVDQPELVIEAVRGVVEAVRQGDGS